MRVSSGRRRQTFRITLVHTHLSCEVSAHLPYRCGDVENEMIPVPKYEIDLSRNVVKDLSDLTVDASNVDDDLSLLTQRWKWNVDRLEQKPEKGRSWLRAL